MGFCPKCGEKQDNNEAKFCQKCGVDMRVNNEVHNNYVSNKLHCMYCGSEIPDGFDKCPACGKYLDSEANKNTLFIILGYVCAIFFPIIGFIVGFYLITRKTSDVHNHSVIIIFISLVSILISNIFQFLF